MSKTFLRFRRKVLRIR